MLALIFCAALTKLSKFIRFDIEQEEYSVLRGVQLSTNPVVDFRLSIRRVQVKRHRGRFRGGNLCLPRGLASLRDRHTGPPMMG